MKIFNELFGLLICYHLFPMTDFMTNIEVRNSVGQSMIVVTLTNLGINILLIAAQKVCVRIRQIAVWNRKRNFKKNLKRKLRLHEDKLRTLQPDLSVLDVDNAEQNSFDNKLDRQVDRILNQLHKDKGIDHSFEVENRLKSHKQQQGEKKRGPATNLLESRNALLAELQRYSKTKKQTKDMNLRQRLIVNKIIRENNLAQEPKTPYYEQGLFQGNERVQ